MEGCNFIIYCCFIFEQVITKPGSVKTYKRFEAEIYALTKDEGGGQTAFFSNYRPQFYLRTTDITSKMELPENIKIVIPGDDVTAVFELISPVPLEASEYGHCFLKEKRNNCYNFMTMFFQTFKFFPHNDGILESWWPIKCLDEYLFVNTTILKNNHWFWSFCWNIDIVWSCM